MTVAFVAMSRTCCASAKATSPAADLAQPVKAWPASVKALGERVFDSPNANDWSGISPLPPFLSNLAVQEVRSQTAQSVTFAPSATARSPTSSPSANFASPRSLSAQPANAQPARTNLLDDSACGVPYSNFCAAMLPLSAPLGSNATSYAAGFQTAESETVAPSSPDRFFIAAPGCSGVAVPSFNQPANT